MLRMTVFYRPAVEPKLYRIKQNGGLALKVTSPILAKAINRYAVDAGGFDFVLDAIFVFICESATSQNQRTLIST